MLQVNGSGTVAGGSGPSGIANIWEWWEAEMDGYTNGATITGITGQANARHITVDASQRPTFATNQINSLGAVRFDATTYVFIPDMTALTASHVFMVLYADSDAPGGQGSIHKNTGSGASSHYPFSDGVWYESWGTTTRLTVGNPTPTLIAWRLAEVISTSSEYTVLLDGTQINTRGTNTVGFSANPSDRRFGVAGFTGWAGYMFGIYQFSAKLTTDRAALITYLNTRLATSWT